jgi:hypothetical protein
MKFEIQSTYGLGERSGNWFFVSFSNTKKQLTDASLTDRLFLSYSFRCRYVDLFSKKTNQKT